MKKGISILMIMLMLFGAVLPAGCSAARGKGSDVCLAFIEYIAEGSYGAAYDRLTVRRQASVRPVKSASS